MPYATATIRFVFEIYLGRVDAPTLSSVAAAAEIHVSGSGGAGHCGYYFSFRPTSTSLRIEEGASAEFPLSSHVQPGTWTHVELTIANDARAMVTLDGAAALSAVVPSGCKYGVVTAVDVGLLCVQPNSGELDVHIDDVAVYPSP
jgi:hypothetical protein